MFPELSDLNYLAVLIPSLAALVVGFAWYLPPVLGTYWGNQVKQYAHLTDDDIKPDPPRHLSLWFAGLIVNAFVIALIVKGMGLTDVLDGVLLGLAVWAGFAMSFSSWAVIFAKQQLPLWLVNNGAYLAMQIVMSVILVIWD